MPINMYPQVTEKMAISYVSFRWNTVIWFIRNDKIFRWATFPVCWDVCTGGSSV